jgi:hypothetical protein
MQIFAQLPHGTLEVTAGTVTDLPDERLRRLADYWSVRCKAGGVPTRADIDPLDFPDLLANIMLIERVMEAGADRYRFRLAGTDIALHRPRTDRALPR